MLHYDKGYAKYLPNILHGYITNPIKDPEDLVISLSSDNTAILRLDRRPGGGGGREGRVLDISLGGEVRRGPSYPDPV